MVWDGLFVGTVVSFDVVVKEMCICTCCSHGYMILYISVYEQQNVHERKWNKKEGTKRKDLRLERGLKGNTCYLSAWVTLPSLAYFLSCPLILQWWEKMWDPDVKPSLQMCSLRGQETLICLARAHTHTQRHESERKHLHKPIFS